MSHRQASSRGHPKEPTVLHYVKIGWPQKVEPQLSLYFARRNELIVKEDCLLKGIQVVVPHKRVLALLHESHLGVMNMKPLARSHIWWQE